VKPELDNWRAALEWALTLRGDLGIGQRLAGALSGFWFAEGAPVEGRRWIRAALQTSDDTTPPAIRAKLDLAEARIALSQSQTRVLLDAAEQAFLLYQQADDRLGMAEAQVYVGFGLIFGGRIAEGEALVRNALAVARSSGVRKLIAPAINALAQARYLASDLTAARGFFRESLAMYKGAGRERPATAVAINLAEAEFQAGDIESALQLGRDAIDVLRANNMWVALAGALGNHSAYLVALSRYEEARSTAREALALARDAEFGAYVAWALQHLAAIAALRGSDGSVERLDDLRSAARILGFVDARFAQLESPRQYTEQQEYDKILPVLRDALGADHDALMREGQQWSEDHAVAEALKI
jgi:tetratricopeptide (TPR) repeat protein